MTTKTKAGELAAALENAPTHESQSYVVIGWSNCGEDPLTDAAAELRRLAAVERELEAHRLYARALCKAIDAATDFAGTVAGGASWWDDVWADHAAALDRARERISNAQGGEQ